MTDCTLITGARGNLGRHLVMSKLFPNALEVDIEDFDITQAESVRQFFHDHSFGRIIHCAAMARLAECDTKPDMAVLANIIGTANLVTETIRKERSTGTSIRFVHISTDGVYEGKRGNYSETDPTIPYTKYGWTKVGAEASVRLLTNHCIIRTRFFAPEAITFDKSPTDLFTSKIPVMELVKHIHYLTNCDFVGLINVGGERISDYEMNRRFKPDLKPCLAKEILKDLSFSLHQDASMSTKLWEQTRNK